MLWMGNIQAHWTNEFVKSLFLVGGLEGVSGVEVAIRRNAFRVSPETPSVGFALVTFATREAASEALARLHDTPVPGAEGHARFLLRKHAATLQTTTETPETERDGVSLQSQLAPLDVTEVRRRLELFGAPSDPEREREVRASGGNGALRLWLLRRLCAAHGEVFFSRTDARTAVIPGEPSSATPRGVADVVRDGPRRVVPRVFRRADPETTTRALPLDAVSKCLHTLRTTEWPRVSDRVAVDADGYISLSSLPGANARRRRRNAKYRNVWVAARDLLASVAGEEAASQFDGLAVTKNVRGSPHIDALDVAAQFAASLGTFSDAAPSFDGAQDFPPSVTEKKTKKNTEQTRPAGGFLCVESGPSEVVCVDTRDAVAAIDGRFVHWVDPAYEGERFSLVWYKRTTEKSAGEPPARAVHERWWDAAYWRDREARGDAPSWVHTGVRAAEKNQNTRSNAV